MFVWGLWLNDHEELTHRVLVRTFSGQREYIIMSIIVAIVL